ncbi:MAG: hypothetical protein HQ582_32510 [Planctomycetes bacterium]|nr:hypothetical protein [Planctomycetota bacterium]
MDSRYHLAVMGRDRDGQMDRLFKLCSRIVHVPFISPPIHLEVTSHAHIGIVGYNFDCLNSLFCAPNKIWEYAGFGVPMLCRDNPGLIYTVEAAKAGVCVGFEDRGGIVQGLRLLESQYKEFSKSARSFFESFDILEAVRRIVLSALGNDQRRRRPRGETATSRPASRDAALRTGEQRSDTKDA